MLARFDSVADSEETRLQSTIGELTRDVRDNVAEASSQGKDISPASLAAVKQAIKTAHALPLPSEGVVQIAAQTSIVEAARIGEHTAT